MATRSHNGRASGVASGSCAWGCSVSSSGGDSGSGTGGGGCTTWGSGSDGDVVESSCGVCVRGGVGSNATQPWPSNAISTQASTSSPVNVTSSDGSPPSASSLDGWPAPSSSRSCDATKPITTREGRPIWRAINAIAEAYCSPSPTIRSPPSNDVRRSAPWPDNDG